MRIKRSALAAIAIVFGWLPSAHAQWEAELEAYWPFDGSLADLWSDWDGVSQGAKPHRDLFVEGQVGSAISLNGEDDYIKIFMGPEPALNRRPSTASFWIRLDQEKSSGLFFAGPDGWRVDYQEPGYILGPGHVRPETLAFNEDNRGQWLHVVISVSPICLPECLPTQMFLNGELVPTTFKVQGRAYQKTTGTGQDLWLHIGGQPGFTSLMKGQLDELIVWRRQLSPEEIEMLYLAGREGQSFLTLLQDEDSDDLPDEWESLMGIQEALEDNDEDGLDNRSEFLRGLDPWQFTTDGDSFSDSVETNTGVWVSEDDPGTNPILSDSDGDGLIDSAENPDEGGTDPNLWDTDGDGFGDGGEYDATSDPLDPGSKPDLRVGLKGYWPFDDSFEDWAGKHHGVAPQEGPEPTLEKGYLEDAVRLDGSNHVRIASEPTEFAFQNRSFTVAYWYKLDRLQSIREKATAIAQGTGRTWHVIAEISDYPDGNGWAFHVPRGENRFMIDGVRPDPTPSSERPRIRQWNTKDAQWHHVVGTYRSLKGNYGGATQPLPLLYLDGVLIEQARWSGGYFPTESQHEDSDWGLTIGGAPNDRGRGYWGLIGLMDDVAIWDRVLSTAEVRAIYNGGYKERKALRDLFSPDSDSDGLPDDWEERNGLNIAQVDHLDDPDQDALVNEDEFARKTNPQIPDTDGDGLLDSVETITGTWVSEKHTGTDPLLRDTDGDGLDDGAENPDRRFVPGAASASDPNRIDTDDDGVDDDVEYKYGTNPLDPASRPSLDDGLVGYWPFEDNLQDHGQGIHHGEAQGEAPITFKSGRFGQAVHLNGLDQTVVVAPEHEDAFDFPQRSFTIAVWYLTEPHPVPCPEGEFCFYSPRLATKGSFLGGFQLGSSYKRLRFNGFWAEAITTDVDGLWHQAVGVVDATRDLVRFYQDGQVLHGLTYTIAIDANSGPLIFGGPDGAPGRGGSSLDYTHWAGMLDDIAIWNRALSTDEVERLWHSDKPLAALAKLPSINESGDPDADHDGMSDRAENIAGTDPNDAGDYLHIIHITRTNGITLTWTSVKDRRYFVEYAPDLRSEMWGLITEDPVLATAGETSFEDSDMARVGSGRGYYRVRVAP